MSIKATDWPYHADVVKSAQETAARFIAERYPHCGVPDGWADAVATLALEIAVAGGASEATASPVKNAIGILSVIKDLEDRTHQTPDSPELGARRAWEARQQADAELNKKSIQLMALILLVVFVSLAVVLIRQGRSELWLKALEKRIDAVSAE